MRARRLRHEAELHGLINELIHLELASIGALDAAVDAQDDPGYVMLYHAAKSGKGASVEQLITLLRIAGEQVKPRGLRGEWALRLQTRTMQRLETSAALRAMQAAQAHLQTTYERALEGAEGVPAVALERCRDRAIVQRFVLTAHLAQREHRAADLERLGHPLGSLFAHGVARVCMRCLLDRPGTLPAIERRDPQPFTYICGACHDEVLPTLPPDLLQQAPRWPARARHDRVAEHALGRPSRLEAENVVLARLAGLTPRQEVPAAKRAAKTPAPGPRRLNPAPVPSTLEVPESDGPESSYTKGILHYREPRRHW